ncbi:MAG TPA: hypothetical protein DCZ88_10345 [Pseudanabaena sp.]|nr:hypothetical protein [Pseudanabaena sp.]
MLDRVRDRIRVKHYSYRTEETYVQWIRQFILFHNKCYPHHFETGAFLFLMWRSQHLSTFQTSQAKLTIIASHRDVIGKI